jgi:hypothetical protein
LLIPDIMRSLLVAALVVGSSSVATAGTYVSLGVGGAPSGQGELNVAAASGTSKVTQQRVALGTSFGRIAIEATLGRFGIGAGDAVVAGVHGRISVPLDGHFGAYGRVGVERAWLSDLEARFGDSADGLAAGLGLEYKLSMPILGQASVWAEGSQDQWNLADQTKGGVRMWTVGLTLGL